VAGKGTPGISIVVPALNEAQVIRNTLLALQNGRGDSHEIIVVDGGSKDGTPEVCVPLADIVVLSPPGRAVQMNNGAQLANHDLYWFVHADTIVPGDAIALIRDALGHSRKTTTTCWGRFDVRFDSKLSAFSVIAWFMNKRSCLTGIATGDQCIFVTRSAFDSVGGFPDQLLMEDVELSSRLRKISAPACIHMPVITSCRRWQQNGIVKTVLLMWKLRLAYFFGASPESLASLYRGSANN